MSDVTTVLKPGTFVWVKLKSTNKIWWPGKVVHPSALPKALIKEYMLGKKKVLAVVSFETDSTFEFVYKMAEIFLYSCDRKMEFLKIGYSLYLKQKKNKFVWSCNMENFIKDVTIIEKEIGGENDIFHQFEVRTDNIPPPVNIKELFMTEKERRLKEKKKKLLLAKSLVSKKKHQTKKNKPSTSQQTTPTINKHKCVKNGCTYSTNYFSNITRHIARHEIEKRKEKKIVQTKNTSNAENSIEEEGENENTVHNTNQNVSGTIASSQTPKKRVAKKKSSNKKMISQGDISIEWENSGDESTVQSTSKNIVGTIASFLTQKESDDKYIISQDDISTEWENSGDESTDQSTNENVMETIASSSQLPKKRFGKKKPSNNKMISQDDISTEWENSGDENTNENGSGPIALPKIPKKRFVKKKNETRK